jgi:hypothetical protein
MPAPAGSTVASLPIGQPIPAWNFVLIPEDGAFRLIILSDNISSGYINIRSPQFTTVALFGRETLSAPGPPEHEANVRSRPSEAFPPVLCWTRQRIAAAVVPERRSLATFR